MSFAPHAARPALRERIRAEEQLVRSEKLATAGQLAAGIAHEIGTPLGIVRARAELATGRLGADHAETPGLRVIVDQIDHVTRLIAQLFRTRARRHARTARRHAHRDRCRCRAARDRGAHKHVTLRR